jgi:hypothetical protein
MVFYLSQNFPAIFDPGAATKRTFQHVQRTRPQGNNKMKAAARLAIGVLLLSCATALDVVMRSIRCDKSLPVYVMNRKFKFTCNGKRRCTFGQTALLQGQVIYNGVEDASLYYGSIAFVSAAFDISVDYVNIKDGTEIDLCHSSYVSPVDEAITCPSDGRYYFNTTFRLPTYRHSWWATGWHDSGHFNIYTNYQETTRIGSCELHYVTKVTSKSLIHLPPAASVVFFGFSLMIIGVVYAIYYMVFLHNRRAVGNVDGGGLFTQSRDGSRVKRFFRRGLFGRSRNASISKEGLEACEQQVNTTDST